MDWEERQTSLENEMMVAKDTIWGLQARIIHLENEVKNLKIVVKYGAKKYSTDNVSKARKSEIAKRFNSKIIRPVRKKIVSEPFKSASLETVSVHSDSNANSSEDKSPNSSRNNDLEDCEDVVVIKEELMIPETDSEYAGSEVSNMSDDSNDEQDISPPGTSNSRNPKGSYSRHIYPSKRVCNSKTLRSNEPVHPKLPAGANLTKEKTLPTLHRRNTNIGRKRDPIWQHFRVVENLSESGATRPTAFCKKCDRIVSPQPGRLSKHVKTCKGRDDVLDSKEPSLGVSKASVDAD